MKKTVTISLLGILMYSSVGFIINFQYALAEWRQERRIFMHNNINKEQFVRFTVHQSDEKAQQKEFSKSNTWFDVFKKETVGDSVILYCLEDHKEKELHAAFQAAFLEDNTVGDNIPQTMRHVIESLSAKYLPHQSFVLIQPTPSVFGVQNTIPTYLSTVYSSPYLDFLSPPPLG